MAKRKENTEEPIETQLWRAAAKLRKNIDAAEYKHIVLGLVFLKYISDAFVELYSTLKEGKGDRIGGLAFGPTPPATGPAIPPRTPLPTMFARLPPV